MSAMEDQQTFSCRHCGVTERYDPPEFYLLDWWQASEAFDQQHRACQTAARPSLDRGEVG